MIDIWALNCHQGQEQSEASSQQQQSLIGSDWIASTPFTSQFLSTHCGQGPRGRWDAWGPGGGRSAWGPGGGRGTQGPGGGRGTRGSGGLLGHTGFRRLSEYLLNAVDCNIISVSANTCALRH